MAPPVAVADPFDDLPDPDVWEAPEEVNRTAVGDEPSGVWTYEGSQPGQFGASAATEDEEVAAPGLGVQDFYGFHEFPVLGADSLAVNLANGNVVLRSGDVAINGPGIGLSIERFYNGLAERQGALGQGWSLTAGQDVGLEIDEGQVRFRAPSGFLAAFELVDGEWVAPSGLNASLVETAEGEWELTYDRTDETQVFSAGGYLLRSVERNGNALTYRYDDDDVLVSITDAAGRVTTLDYDDGLLTQINDPADREVTYTYDDEGRLTGHEIPTSSATGKVRSIFSYDDQDQLVAISAGAGSSDWEISIELDYDDSGRVTGVTQHNGDEDPTLWAINYASGQTVVTDPAGGQSTYVIDAQGRVGSTTDPLGRTHSQVWTANSAIASLEDAMGDGAGGNVTEFAYDDLNNPTSVAMPTGAAASATYTIGGGCDSVTEGHRYKVKCATDTEGNPSSFDYDEAGNLTTSRSGSGTGARELTYTYHGVDGEDCGAYPGQICTSTNGEGNTTTFTYDEDGNLAEITPPSPASPTVLTYNSVGMVLTATTGAMPGTEYSYDAVGRMTVLQSDTSQPIRTHYTYDGANRLTSDSQRQPVADGRPATFQRLYAYSGGLGITETHHRFTDQRIDQPRTATVSVGHDERGNVTGIATTRGGVADPDGEVSYVYDAANQLTHILEAGGTCDDPGAASSGCIQMEYDNNGAETARTYPGGAKVETEHDDSGRPIRITTVDFGGEAVTDYSYSFDADGQDSSLIQARTDHVGLQAPAGSVTSYGYDSLNRLTQAVEEDADGQIYTEWAYAYDRNGNRTLADGIEYAYDAADRITQIDGEDAGLTYNDRGDLLNTPGGAELTYSDNGALQDALSADGESEVETLHTGETNADPFQMTVNDETIRYLTSPLGHLNEFDVDAGQEVGVTRAPDGSPLALRDGDSTRYLATDILGSTVAELDPAGSTISTHSYDPYGQNLDQAPSVFGFAAGVHNPALDLTRFGARHYTPTLGTFTQIDPSGAEDNPYLYAAANPINNTDPTGLSTARCMVAALFATGAYIAFFYTLHATFAPGAAATVGAVAAATPGVGAIIVLAISAAAVGYAIYDIYESCG